ncbi:hypothetical protein Pth03_51860 [Planotetraspora thailandica]|uniref:LamG-like jellyroll fold domain-containing protein n=1 Tax=Planotetraspora thailandica TaxID=487172 RepID=A0A8J3XVQ7_9ACTN|nr:LamG-like jellyroll fold domain-containing protein [Planotetraspora thailandica]GII56797.1 hypothetical protein Pth03_51860 [Planotetraspora thailandica]
MRFLRHRLAGVSVALAAAAFLVGTALPAQAAVERGPAPTGLLSNGKPCATGDSRPYVLTTTPTLAAVQTHPNAGLQMLTSTFSWWPVGGSPNETDTVSRLSGNPATVSATIPADRLTDGASYAWKARTFDGTHFSPWSDRCEFTVDMTPPPAPGGVTSDDYPVGRPSGGTGVAGVFEIVPPASQAEDVVAYAYTLDSGVVGGETVPARAGDHGASVTVTPTHDGPNRLFVRSKDRAGRLSTPFTYTFSVRAPAGAAAEWTFEEPGGDAVDVRHGNTAVLSGGATRTGGRSDVGEALSLNGTSAFAATSGPVLAPDPDTQAMTPVRTDRTFTVTARVKLAATGGDDVAAVSADGTRTSAYVLGYSGSTGRWTFRLAGSDIDDPASAIVSSDAAPEAGRWTHLAGVYDSATRQLRLYVNGVQQSATATLTGGFDATGPVALGRAKAAGAAAGFLGGAVDDVRVYGYAETAANLAAFAAPLPPRISFPEGSTVPAGGRLTVRFDAGDDTNVTKFRYSVDGLALEREISALEGSATVTIDPGAAGRRTIFAAAEDDGGRRSPLTQGDYTVKSVIRVSGTVWDVDTFIPVEGATVTLEPGGLSMVTGPDGAYDFTGFPEGHYTLSAVKDGACPLSGSIELDISGELLGTDVFVVRPSDDSGSPTCVP